MSSQNATASHDTLRETSFCFAPMTVIETAANDRRLVECFVLQHCLQEYIQPLARCGEGVIADAPKPISLKIQIQIF